MCGISCVVHQGDPSAIDRTQLSQELSASLEAIKHRGPDSRGQWISDDNRVALGHVRLAINDLHPTGAQPFHSPSSDIHAVVNGELYDYDALRSTLPTYPFAGHSDCELVIALYQAHGLSFLSHLRGEFALCLYDARTRLFVAARDRYGIKPLFWRVNKERLEVAAEQKAWLPFGWAPEWDVASLMEAGWNHDARTLFRGVQKVRPGHYIVCQGFGGVEERPYWDIEYPDKRVPEQRSEQEMIEGVRERLLEAVRIRLRADVPVGIYLSGGIDSSVIAGMVTHLVKERGEKIGNENETDRVSCFGIAFDEESGYDESSIANRTADFLGVKFHKKHMGESELAAYFEDATYHCEHHMPDLNYIGKFALSEVPREVGFKVVLTGEGSDENFAGYNPTYLPDYLREPDISWPANPLPEEKRERLREEMEALAERNYKAIGMDCVRTETSVAERMLNGIKTPAYMTAWGFDVYAPWTYDVHGIFDPRLTVANNVDGRTRDMMMNKWHPLHSAMYVWSKGHLANSFLSCLGDRTEMAHSLEARTPFLDHHLTEYVNGLPPSVKIRWDEKDQRFVEKWILREASKPFITKELYERKKHPYSAPTLFPVNGPLHQLFSRLISRENVESLGFVDWNKARYLVKEAFEEGNPSAMRAATSVGQWIVLGKRFGVKKANAPSWWSG